MAVVLVCSFYVYQRVWVRNLVSEIETIQKKNLIAGQQLSRLQSQWAAASSIIEIEARIDNLKLKLRPTRPSQNLVLRPDGDRSDSRFAGLNNAWNKVKRHLPLVAPSEAGAEELFDTK